MSNIPQLAVDSILAAIEEGDVRFVKKENVVIDKTPLSDWSGEPYIVINEELSKGTNHQHGIGPARTPIAIRAWGKDRKTADSLCKEAAEAVRVGLSRLMRRGLGIHGVYVDAERFEGKKNAQFHGGARPENVAVRFLIVYNSINTP